MRIRNIFAFIFAITLFTSVACAQILQVKPVDEVTEVIPSDITFTGEPADETASPDPTDELVDFYDGYFTVKYYPIDDNWWIIVSVEL